MHNYFTNYHTPTCCFLCFLNFIPTFFPLHSLSFLLYSFMLHLPDSISPFLATLLPILSFILFARCSSFVCFFHTFTSSLIISHFLLILLLLLNLRHYILTLFSLLSLIFSYSPPAVHKPWNYKVRWILGLTSTLRLSMHCLNFLNTLRLYRPRNDARSCWYCLYATHVVTMSQSGAAIRIVKKKHKNRQQQ